MADVGSSTATPEAAPLPTILRVGQPSPLPHEATQQLSANGHANGTTVSSPHSPNVSTPEYLSVILPTGKHPLSGISLRAHGLGLALGLSTSLTIYLLSIENTLWRAPFFITSLSLFHFLEFYITAAYNTPLARVEAFLLTTNGAAYNAAHTLAMLETIMSHGFGLYGYLFPLWVNPFVIGTGLLMMSIGQVMRSVAMAQAGTNFNHTVQWRKSTGHQLVTYGIYSWSRHPSYFGFFWWGLGTQLVLGNVFCFLGYAGILWWFFKVRIQREEQYLIKFFGDDYINYRRKTGVGIPFVS